MMSGAEEIRRTVVARLRDIIDPEIGINIVDLGLIYAIRVEDGDLEVQYATTTPGCPLRRFIEQQIKVAVQQLPGITRSEVLFVTSPSWQVEMVAGHVSLFRSQAR